ncbi:MAG: GNAT family N-acetyltransferase [Butyrivibrio sp.]|nr:GNAT family N-acetyltransferase [Butyrivibrio sp.]
MLSNIYFCLLDDTDQAGGFDIIAEKVSKQVDNASKYLTECGYSCRKAVFSQEQVDNGDILLSLDDGSRPLNIGETLFVVDSMIIGQQLIKRGCYCIGFQHDGNSQESFSGVKYVFQDIDMVEEDSYVKAYQRAAHLPWKVLETDRCIIRETTVEDVDSFYKIYSDPEMTRYIEGLFENPEDEKRYTKDYIDKVYGLMGFGTWTVVLKSTEEVIGRAGFSIRKGFDDVELGFLIATPFQRHGYAYEVCSAIMDYGRDILQFDKVQTFVKKENEVSVHLCKKLGFKIVDEQDIEENIYGDVYGGEQAVSLGQSHYGHYVRMVWNA